MSNLMSKPNNTLAIVDSQLIRNYPPSSATVTQRTIAKHPISIEAANSNVIQSTEIGSLKNTDLPTNARKVYLFPELQRALLFIGLFCDNISDVLFKDEHVIVIDR